MRRIVSKLWFFREDVADNNGENAMHREDVLRDFAPQHRFLSLDVFRGLTVCLMIIVNSPGKGAALYPALVHAKWFGFTMADLVFPSFLFAVGNAMSFTMRKLEHQSHGYFIHKVVKRTLFIFLLGYLLYWFPFVKQLADGSWVLKSVAETRIMGVLQRIALCYLIASMLVRYVSSASLLIIIAGVILTLYWGLLQFFGDAGNEMDMEGNAVRKFDLMVLGLDHMYKRDSIPFDPEGILSTLPAVVNVIAGYLTGNFIRQQVKLQEGLVRLVALGILLIVLALIIHPFFPVSKKLWTSSFVLLTIGIDLSVLVLLIYAFELKDRKFGVSFFSIFGKNPLFIYLFSEVFFILLNLVSTPSGAPVWEWLSVSFFQRVLPGSPGSLLGAVLFMLMCWAGGWGLDKKRIYIRL